MESVIEFYDRGASPSEALSRALASTGNIICVAGIIMSLAFGALLVGDSAALNQIGYLLMQESLPKRLHAFVTVFSSAGFSALVSVMALSCCFLTRTWTWRA